MDRSEILGIKTTKEIANNDDEGYTLFYVCKDAYFSFSM